MDIQFWINTQYHHALAWWHSLGPQGPYYVWFGAGLVSFTFLVLTWYYWFRKLLGHRKFRGTWYNETEFQGLLLTLAEDQDSGRRVMRYDEIELLREWRTGIKKSLGFDQRNTYF